MSASPAALFTMAAMRDVPATEPTQAPATIADTDAKARKARIQAKRTATRIANRLAAEKDSAK